MKVETASLEDLPEILSLQKLAYVSEAEIYNDFSIPPLLENLEKIKQAFLNQIFLKVTVGDQIIGSVRGYMVGTTCYIGRLIVHPDHQNKGFGSRLMAEIERRFLNAERYELFTGERSERNLHLYRKFGYLPIKRRPMINQVNLVVLEKWNR